MSALSIEKVESLAPDQASLDAARKLYRRRRYPGAHLLHPYTLPEVGRNQRTPQAGFLLWITVAQHLSLYRRRAGDRLYSEASDGCSNEKKVQES